MNVSATHRAGTVRPVLSVPGKPDPMHWARITTDMIVTVAPDATFEQRMAVASLRRSLAVTMFEALRGLTKFNDQDMAALHIEERIYEIIQPTQWNEVFAIPSVKQAIRDVLTRNVTSYISILGN